MDTPQTGRKPLQSSEESVHASQDAARAFVAQRPYGLSFREAQIAEMMHLSRKEIAAQVGIAEATVKFHLRTVYAKLGAVSKADAVRIYIGGSFKQAA